MLKHLIPPQLRLAAAGLAAASIFAAGAAAAITVEHRAPWGLAAKRDAAEAEADANLRGAYAWEAHARGWEATARATDAFRAQEQARAVAAANAAQASCSARVAAARKSALAIQSIVNREVPHDPQGCPTRQLVDPRELRNALRR